MQRLTAHDGLVRSRLPSPDRSRGREPGRVCRHVPARPARQRFPAPGRRLRFGRPAEHRPRRPHRPGPDYKLYLSPELVETEADFERLKPRMVPVGDVRTLENFVVPVPESIDVSAYDTVIVWCESFSQFITAARYR
ncbi:MAG: DM13 domain-containing protein [Burkholderiaceae bacterium]|nr:DM13 domain-containing protein [Burkholderiaceae bacterium]